MFRQNNVQTKTDMAASILLYCHGRANKMAPWVEVLATCLDHLNLIHKMEEENECNIKSDPVIYTFNPSSQEAAADAAL